MPTARKCSLTRATVRHIISDTWMLAGSTPATEPAADFRCLHAEFCTFAKVLCWHAESASPSCRSLGRYRWAPCFATANCRYRKFLLLPSCFHYALLNIRSCKVARDASTVCSTIMNARPERCGCDTLFCYREAFHSTTRPSAPHEMACL